MQKKQWFTVFVIMLAFGLIGCASKQGPVGETGADGQQGLPGPAGADGAQGPVGPAGVDGINADIPAFAGSEACAECHEELYAVFMKSGHPYKLNAVVDGQAPEYPFSEVPNPPEGYTWDDISYVIGGYNWKARFIDQNGYIITGDANATTQYNLYNSSFR